VDFGSYKDVVTDHDIGRQLGMSLDFGSICSFSGLDVPTPRSMDITFASNSEQTADLCKSSVQGEDGRVLASRTRRESGGYNHCRISQLVVTRLSH
jgi:hypothetical protein